MDTRETVNIYFKLFVMALIVAINGLAVEAPRAADQRFSERDVAMLPDFCRYRMDQGANPDEYARYERLIGPMFLHVHHYCYGLAYTNQAKLRRVSQRDRDHLLSQSITEFQYVISRVPADFVLLPEILTKTGENLLRLRRIPEALSTLQRAVESKPDYWPAYAVLSDHYKGLGEVDKAREWLEKGIAASPNSRALELRKRELKNVR